MSVDDHESVEVPQSDDLPPTFRDISAGLVADRPIARMARPEWSADSEVVRYPEPLWSDPNRWTVVAEPAAFDLEEFLSVNRQSLLDRLCWFCRGDKDLAEDVVQETFFAAHRHREKLAAYERPEGWLYVVATRAAIKVFQREHLGRTKQIEAAALRGAAAVEETESFDEMVEVLTNARERQVITLLFFFGYSRKEVAKALGISVRTVASVKSSALQRLKSSLTTEGEQS